MPDLKLFRSPDSEEFDRQLGQAAGNLFPSGARLAVKLHMGEGRFHCDPALTARCVSVLRDLGLDPFLFDSPVMYPGERHTPEGYLKRAADNGFSEEAIGCPVLVSNESRVFKGHHISVGVCRDLIEADGVLALSHFKGHPCTGAAGALKNLGMGGVDRKTKTAIHERSKPVLTGDCDACGECAEGCTGSAIKISDKAVINPDACWGCGRCIDTCPQGAFQPKHATFDALLIDGAAAVLSGISHILCVNDARRITRLCDCCRDPGPEIVPDVGLFLGSDPVAIDNASVDQTIRAAGEDTFRAHHGRDSYSHIREAAARGLGSMDYSVTEM